MDKRILIAVSSPGECKAVLAGLGCAHLAVPELWQTVAISPRLSVLNTGVGKSNAAAAVSKQLAQTSNATAVNGERAQTSNATAVAGARAQTSNATVVAGELAQANGHNGGTEYGAVLNVGVAGSYDPSIGLASSVLGLKHWMLDEGTIVNREPGWVSIEEAGWATISVEPVKGELHKFFETIVDHTADVGTVSTISGTAEQRDAYLKRAPVKIETMESCSIALVCSMFSIEYIDVRVVSNFCGERTSDNHDFPGALTKLSKIVETWGEHIGLSVGLQFGG